MTTGYTKKLQDRAEALQKEITRVGVLEEFDDLVAAMGATLVKLGVSSADRDKTLRPLWNFLDVQIAKEPYIPGVEYVQPASQ